MTTRASPPERSDTMNAILAQEPEDRTRPADRPPVSLIRDVIVPALLEVAARHADWPRRLLLCHYGARLCSLGLNAGTSGNLSIRLREGTSIYITPRGTDKGCLRPSQIRRLSLLDHGTAPPDVSVEVPMHRACYAARLGVGAVVHAHPPGLTALPLRGLELTAALPESGAALGGVGLVRFAPSGSDTLAELVGDAVGAGASLVLLERHGAVAVGPDLASACKRMEQGELVAFTTLMAAGQTSGMPDEHVPRPSSDSDSG
jgi:L-fuculose-phosphate aldolase